jgi:hypothetical protein
VNLLDEPTKYYRTYLAANPMPRTRPASKLANNPYNSPKHYYPQDLGNEGSEPYILFDIRAGVVDKPTPLAVIGLPMPLKLGVSYGAAYKEVSMTLDVYKSLANHMEPITELGRIIAKGLDTTGSNLSAEFERSRGAIVNPHMATLFEGIGFRSFTFDFTLAARNREESDSIQKLIARFKYHMVPGVPVGGAYQRDLLYPDNFVISLHSPVQSYLFKIGTCALKNMDVDYSGAGQTAFFRNSGAPVMIHLTLTFQEMTIMTKELIEQGY